MSSMTMARVRGDKVKYEYSLVYHLLQPETTLVALLTPQIYYRDYLIIYSSTS